MAKIDPTPIPNVLADEAPSLRSEAQPSIEVANLVQPPVTPPVVVTDAKSPVKSKLNWAGAILTVVGALQLAQEMHLIDTLIPSEDVRAKASAAILFIGGVLTIVLRTFFTAQPTTLTDTKRRIG